jgi:hypothetical protein
VPVLEEMIKKLSINEATQELDTENVVRANTIKLLKEVCLIVGVSSKTFCEWQEKFCRKTKQSKDEQGNMKEVENENYSEAISELIQKIRDICECRLQYSGMAMDMFLLKNHYDHRDQFAVDSTTNGKDIPGSAGITVTAPIVQIIEQG